MSFCHDILGLQLCKRNEIHTKLKLRNSASFCNEIKILYNDSLRLDSFFKLSLNLSRKFASVFFIKSQGRPLMMTEWPLKKEYWYWAWTLYYRLCFWLPLSKAVTELLLLVLWLQAWTNDTVIGIDIASMGKWYRYWYWDCSIGLTGIVIDVGIANLKGKSLKLKLVLQNAKIWYCNWYCYCKV